MKRTIFLLGILAAAGVLSAPVAAQDLSGQLFSEGMKLYSAQDYGGAVFYLEQLCQMNPQNQQARYYLFYSLVAMKRHPEAMKHVDQLISRDPGNRQYQDMKSQLRAAMGVSSQAPAGGTVEGLLKKFLEGGFKEQSEIRATLAEKGVPVIEPAMALLRSSPVDSERRRKIEGLLAGLKGIQATQALLRYLNDSEGSVRISIARVLGNRKDPAALNPLQEALPRQDPAGKQSFADAIALISKPREDVQATLSIPDKMQDRMSHVVPSASVDAASTASTVARQETRSGPGGAKSPSEVIGNARPQAAAAKIPVNLEEQKLLQTMKGDDVRQKRFAAYRIGHMHYSSPDAIGHLIRSLSSEDDILHVTALESLGKLGRDAAPAIPQIISAMDKDSVLSMFSGLKSLGAIRSNPELVFPVLGKHLGHSSENVSNAAMRAFVEFGEEGVPFLGELEKSDSERVRTMAEKALAEIRSRSH